MSKNIIADTGFWIGYFEEKDNYHHDALEIASLVFENKIICPFPSLYEFLNTRFTRNIKKVTDYEILLKKLNIEYIYDDDYRNNIINDFILYNKKSKHTSLVDLIINRIIEDVNVKIDYIATFNRDDFAITCIKRNIEFLP
jgi:predicted nucleic acid-binding protein